MNQNNKFNTIQKVAPVNGDTSVLNVNGHLHSPYSFCSFDSIEQMFTMAKEEKISILGINDFFSMDGYPEFETLSKTYGIYPQFNVEFIGLLSDLQAKGIKINDPNNPGRIYFSGKGLKYPLGFGAESKSFINGLIDESQKQIKEMTAKANALVVAIDEELGFTYEDIKAKYAKELVRERHIAKAIRIGVFNKYSSSKDRIEFLTKLYDGKAVKADVNDIASVENELRGNLLKSGGKAFVEEDPAAFPPLKRIIDFILDAGGIPCYPVLLDDKKGNILTEFEADWEEMDKILKGLNVHTVELIPSRNSVNKLREFVQFFKAKGYAVFFGSEHNTPGIFPVEVMIEGTQLLPEDLKAISYEGACIIAAHQQLVAAGEVGYVSSNGDADKENFAKYVELGNAVIKNFVA